MRGTGITMDCNLPVFLARQAHTPSPLNPNFLKLLHFYFPGFKFYVVSYTTLCFASDCPQALSPVLLVWLGEESRGRLVTATGEKGHTMSCTGCWKKGDKMSRAGYF